jgi:hypothetical protein
MLQRKLITVCTGLLVFITMQAKAHLQNSAAGEKPYPVYIILPPFKPHGSPGVANQHSNKAMFGYIAIDNELYYTYQVDLTNLSTNVVYTYYVAPFNVEHATVPDGNYSVSFTQYGGSGGAQHYYTVCNSTTYGYSGSFSNVTLNGSCGSLILWDWP